MALLVWEEVTWPDFVAGLEGFRDHFPRAAQAPDAFPENAADIIRLLNTWACRLSTERAPRALETWLGGNAATLEQLAPLAVRAGGVAARAADDQRRAAASPRRTTRRHARRPHRAHARERRQQHGRRGGIEGPVHP